MFIIIIMYFGFIFIILPLYSQLTYAQTTLSLEDSVKYQKQNNYIKEFEVPIEELGLKGITTDNKNNVWFYHSTNKTSSIFKFNQTANEFKQYNITADTVVDNFVINLAGGQLVFDDNRNIIWFTDARTNSIGMLDIKNEIIQLFEIPTKSSGPMGIVMSPDNESIWFTEILTNKIGTFVIDSFINDSIKSENIIENNIEIVEYAVNVDQNNVDDVGQSEGEGPTLLTFDSEGTLWVTMSYSHNVLRLEPWILKSGNVYNAFAYFTLPNTDTFSPFGITIAQDETSDNSDNNRTTTTKGNFFITDHGSSRVVKTLGDSNAINPFQNYLSYWTSPSSAFPASLPSQIAIDSSNENVYFAQHGGNKISKINLDSGILTEYDIPTGPLSTTVFIAISKDGKKVWFTEYLSNKIAYLDTTIPVPYQMQILTNNSINSISNISSNNNRINNDENNNQNYVIFKNLPKTFDAVLINQNNVNNAVNNKTITNSSILLDDVELSITGMTDSDIVGIQYAIEPRRINLIENPITYSNITLISETSNSKKRVGENMQYNDKSALKQATHTIMVRSSAFVENQSSISLLYPIILDFDIPLLSVLSLRDSYENNIIANNTSDISSSQYKEDIFMSAETIRSILRTVSLPVAIGLIGFIVYRKIKERRIKIKKK